MASLKVSVPTPKPGATLSIGNQYEDIKAWIDSLPLFDAENTLRQVLPVLAELNRTELDNLIRYRSMEPLVLALQHPIERIRQKYLSPPLPLSGKSREAVTAIERLLSEIAHGYKIIIINHATRNEHQLSEEQISNAIYNAISHIGLLILENYLCYETLVPRIWIELNELYKYATKLKIEEVAIKNSEKKRITIERAYMQILLLAAIHPYRLMRGEAAQVFQVLADWSRHCSLSKPKPDWSASNELVVNAAANGMPYHVAPGEQFNNLDDIQIVNIQRLKTLLQNKSNEWKEIDKKNPASTLASRLKRDMFLRLIDGWKSKNERTSPRIRCTEKIELVSGLNACYCIFGGKQAPDQEGKGSLMKLSLMPKEDDCEDPWAATKHSTHMDAGDASNFKVDDPNKDIWDEQALRPTIEDNTEARGIKLYPMVQTDHSAGGLSVHFEFSTGMRPSVGDLVSYKSKESDQSSWKLGAIRWMEFSQKTGDFGIKIFPYTPTPISIKALSGVGKGGDLMQGLLISPEGFEHPEAKVIVPASLYDTETQLYVESASRSVQIVLTAVLDFSKSFACFSFKFASEC